jgi:hypothetical protein
MPIVSIAIIIIQKTLLKQGAKPSLAHNNLLLDKLDQDVAEYLRYKANKFYKIQTEILIDLDNFTLW